MSQMILYNLLIFQIAGQQLFIKHITFIKTIFHYNRMQKSAIISKVDKCVTKFIQNNNGKHKRSITNTYMSRKELETFYKDMIYDAETKYNKIQMQKLDRQKRLRKRKNNSKVKNICMAYQNYDRVQMNRNAFEVQGKENESKIKKTKQMEEEDLKEIQNNIIRNCKNRVRRRTENIHIFDNIENKVNLKGIEIKQPETQEGGYEIDKQDIQIFRRLQEEKYIKKYRIKERKNRFSHNQVNCIPDEEIIHKDDKKLQTLFAAYFQKRQLKEKDNVKQKVYNEIIKKKRLFNEIRKYFYKKNRYMPLR